MASALPLVVLLCLVIGQLDVSAASVCRPGWSLFGSRCFNVQVIKLMMVDAELNCINLGGNLASIHSKSEYNHIRALIKTTFGSDVLTWVGLSDAIEEGKWLWTDGSRFDFSHWAGGQPDNSHGKEHCTNINSNGGSWNDFNCRRRLPSVCQKRH